MNTERLQLLADFIGGLSPEQLTLEAHVIGSTRQRLTHLQAGDRASPVGWLPAVAPDDWCWVTIEDEVVPVYKASGLWTDIPMPLNSLDRCLRNCAIAQAAEWLELNDPLRLITALGYTGQPGAVSPIGIRQGLLALVQ